MQTIIELNHDEVNDAIREYLKNRGVELDITATISVEKKVNDDASALSYNYSVKITQETSPKVVNSFFGIPHPPAVRSRSSLGGGADREVINDR